MFLQKFLFVVEILRKHGRGLLLYAAPCTFVWLIRQIKCTSIGSGK